MWTIDDFVAIESLLTEEERAVRDMVRKFVTDRLLPRVADDFEHHRFARELIPEVARLGLLGAPLQGYGCAGISPVAYGLACRELAFGDSGFRSFVTVQTSLAMYAIWRFGSEAQKQRWLPQMAAGEAIGCFGLSEPESGSDPASMRARAQRDGEDWLLTGEKMWITNAQIADVAVVWAKTDATSRSVRGFLVERGMAGFQTHTIPHKLSMRASHTGSLQLDGVRVPAANVLPEAHGMRGPLTCLSNARFGVSYGVLGAARFCLQAAIDYACDRRQWGGPIAAKQLVQSALADMLQELVKAEALSLHYGRLKERGELRGAQISLMKRNNCSTALDIARRARALLGANGITSETGVMRHAMNLESTFTYEGTHEIHSLVLGHALTGEKAF